MSLVAQEPHNQRVEPTDTEHGRLGLVWNPTEWSARASWQPRIGGSRASRYTSKHNNLNVTHDNF